jgi:hypothetical protein
MTKLTNRVLLIAAAVAGVALLATMLVYRFAVAGV